MLQVASFKAAVCNFIFSRSFMNSASKDSAPRQPERHVVRWLNAINPDRFPEQVIRYVKHSHHVVCRTSFSRHTHSTQQKHYRLNCIHKLQIFFITNHQDVVRKCKVFPFYFKMNLTILFYNAFVFNPVYSDTTA